MAATLPELLTSLTTSLDSAITVLPDEIDIIPPADGISLLDSKNDLFLSYLQNLVFLIILKLKNQSAIARGEAIGDSLNLCEDVVKRLVEHRAYLEKGVRPLEGRLKYQIDKVIRCADDMSRNEAVKPNEKRKPKIKQTRDSSEESAEGSEDDGSDDEVPRLPSPMEDVDELSFRPNPAAFRRPEPPLEKSSVEGKSTDRIYQPPRITPTALPSTRGREDKSDSRPMKSATLDEFISTELSTAPVAEPSVGSTIVSRGRRTITKKEREAEEERRVYEEANFVRLPKPSKKEKGRLSRGRQGGYGGEDWRDLGTGLDRIDRLTQKKGVKSGVLERSRKRPIEDGPRGSGAEIGDAFEKRRKLQTRSRRK
ncbi:hypothetical protein M501DRAFT_1019669 [Patellaria atrata CBS 101060]|uniref:Uncharacterized protein n=1 Tax=Patellaria atrata CBS 101060 TaxID=1346257 RepID=A0A9P4VPN5_9PEZI|nr:hypothetical protein M501DRAFT_1019669 [Patellaria atrata CBS 101060]